MLRGIAARPNRRLLPLAIVVLTLPGIGGCGAIDKHRNRKMEQPGQYDPHQPRELQKVSQPAYVIEPPDELEVTLRPASLDVPVSTVIVRPDGVIDLGFLGEVYVSGLTVPEAELKVAQQAVAMAGSKAGREPVQASIRLVSGGRSKSFYVVGAGVTTPGAYPSTGNETVLDAILRAGLRRNALPEKAYLARPHPPGAGEEILRIDWDCILRGETLTNYQVMPGDRIVVPGGREPGLLPTLLGGG
jgi:polysaccharide export outer membrane protein